MAAPPFIAARVTPEMKSLLRVLAGREQKTESALVRQLLETVLRASAVGADPGIEPPGKASREARLSIRLAPDDRALLAERAAAREMPAATYVSVLVRAHLRALSPLPQPELMALKRAIAELSAIGRNLNQIARVANQGGRAAAIGRNEVMAMLKVAEALRDHMKALLKANERTWRIGHAETAH